MRIDKDEVLVDIGYKCEGVIPSNELSIRKSVDPSEEVELGEEVDALVLTKEDQEGRLILSKKRARFEKAWRRIEAAAESGEPVEGTVIEVVKGGLILDLGVRGFLPASLVDIRRVQNLDEFMGQKLECKVIELNRSRNNVVLSRRAVLEEERKEVREQILGRLQPGQEVEGKISNIVDFGAFVDLEGIDGLIHISELSWSHVNHPSEVLSIGDTVRVKVLDIDRDRQRISLGLKQTQEDPWQRVLNEYKEGDTVERQGHEDRRLRRLRPDPARRRGPRPHLRARPAPRREPRRGRAARRRAPGEDPRGRRLPPPPLAERQARRGPGAAGLRARGGRAQVEVADVPEGEAPRPRRPPPRRMRPRPRPKPKRAAPEAEAAPARKPPGRGARGRGSPRRRQPPRPGSARPRSRRPRRRSRPPRSPPPTRSRAEEEPPRRTASPLA